MTEDRGLKGRVHKLEQRKNWNFPQGILSHVLNRDSFDLEFSTTGQVLVKTSYTYRGIVHRLTRFRYDGAGQVIRSEEFDAKGNQTQTSEFDHTEQRRQS